MTWLKAPENEWDKIKEKNRNLKLLELIRSNPVISRQNGAAAARDIGGERQVSELTGKIIKCCKAMLERFPKHGSAIQASELQLILMRLITEELIKQHVRKMLDDERYEKSARENFRPGCVHYPAHFYVARYDFIEDTIEFFDDRYRNSIYAEFYGEFDDYKDKARRTSETVKGRRPVLLVDDAKFYKVEAVPCSTKQTRLEVKIPTTGRTCYAAAHFLFPLTPAMLQDDTEEIGKIDAAQLRAVKNYLRK